MCTMRTAGLSIGHPLKPECDCHPNSSAPNFITICVSRGPQLALALLPPRVGANFVSVGAHHVCIAHKPISTGASVQGGNSFLRDSVTLVVFCE